MDDCRELEQVLSAYVDGEAAGGDCHRVRSHIENCGVCRERVAGEQAAREALRSRRNTLRACAPDALKARCAAHATTGARVPAPVFAPSRPRTDTRPRTGAVPPTPSFVRRWAPLSLAATVLLAVAAVFGLGLNDRVQALAFQTTLDHMTCSRLKTAPQ